MMKTNDLFDNCTNSKKKGDVGLGAAILYFVKQGFTVSLPLTDSQDYDLIVDMNEMGLKKVQIKSTSYKQKGVSYQINLSVKGGNRSFNTIKKFDYKKVDFIFAVTEDNTQYLIPSTKDLPKNLLNLSKDRDKFIVHKNK